MKLIIYILLANIIYDFISQSLIWIAKINKVKINDIDNNISLGRVLANAIFVKSISKKAKESK